MAKKYAVLGFVLVQGSLMFGMDKTDQNKTELNPATDVLSRSGGLSQSQELNRNLKQAAASYYAISPCCPMAKLRDLKNDWKPSPGRGYSDGDYFP